MARRKKEQSVTEVTTDKVVTETKNKKEYVKPEIKEIKVPKMKEAIMFYVSTQKDEVYFRHKPLLNNDNKNLAGKMIKGQVYAVTAEINFSVKKMYRLKEGYYVIADDVKII